MRSGPASVREPVDTCEWTVTMTDSGKDGMRIEIANDDADSRRTSATGPRAGDGHERAMEQWSRPGRSAEIDLSTPTGARQRAV